MNLINLMKVRLRSCKSILLMLMLIALVIIPAFPFDTADAQTRRLKIAFDKIIVNVTHDGRVPLGVTDIDLDGEYALDVYVNEIRIPLWIGTGLTDIGKGDTVYFGPDKTIELDIPQDGQIRIVTAGFEEDTAGTASALPDVSNDLKRIPTVGEYFAGAYNTVRNLWAANANDAVGIIIQQYGSDQNFGIGGHDDCSGINFSAGDVGDQNETICDYRLVYFIQEVGVGNYAGNPVLVQSRIGFTGNFEVVVPRADGGFNHLFRNNDNPSLPWYGPFPIAREAGRIEAISMIQSNFGDPGTLETVARIGDSLVYFWRESGAPFRWHGPFPIPNSQGSTGNPVLIQSSGFGFDRGNFEVVVPRVDGGFNHFWRDNDSLELRWHGPTPLFTNVGRIEAISMIQSNFGASCFGFLCGGVNPDGNFEVVARTGDNLKIFFREEGDTWREGVPPTLPNSQGSTGNPVLIQSRFGDIGNFEVVVPRTDIGFNYFFRFNDDEERPWGGPQVIMVDEFNRPLGRIDAVSFIESHFPLGENFFHPGNFEVVALMGGNLALFWRETGPNFIWHGPFFLPN